MSLVWLHFSNQLDCLVSCISDTQSI
uniref:Uncharacterized protein n=1 Tax=Rhizophora mucronata TaxID=61149 RepID=A0A2P2MX84_RHIMU